MQVVVHSKAPWRYAEVDKTAGVNHVATFKSAKRATWYYELWSLVLEK